MFNSDSLKFAAVLIILPIIKDRIFHQMTEEYIPAFHCLTQETVSGSWDMTARLWDAVTGVALQTLKGHSGSVTSVAFL